MFDRGGLVVAWEWLERTLGAMGLWFDAATFVLDDIMMI